MKLLKYFLFVSILIVSLFFFVELDSMNVIGDVSNLDPNSSIKIQIPFLVENPNFEEGFEVWVVLLGTLSLGVFVGFIMALFQIISQKSDLIKTRSKLKRVQLELDTLRNQAIDDDIEITDMLDDESNNQLDEFEIK
jgi:hypothetical protein|tara:strand:- start:407 stop:817 length:411 start_codon:yes stop_codon:yes gene_type:complete